MDESELQKVVAALMPALVPALGPVIAEAISAAVVRELRHQRRTAPAPDSWMTQAQAAEYLRISPKTLCAHRAQGKIKGKLFGKRWRYSKESLDAALNSPWLTA